MSDIIHKTTTNTTSKTLKAIETSYNGYLFRSRLEARWAVLFDALEIKYEYEKEGYQLESGWYLPDFWLPEYQIWIEVKGGEPSQYDRDRMMELCMKQEVLGYIVHEPWVDNGECFPRNHVSTWMICDNPGSGLPPTNYRKEEPLPWLERYVREIDKPFPITEEHGLSVTSNNWFDGSKTLLCPVCKEDYVHFDEAEYVDGKDNGEAWSGRGDCINIPMWCEQGCRFTMFMGFHKGMISAWSTNVHTEHIPSFLNLFIRMMTFQDHRPVFKADYAFVQQGVAKAKSARFEHGLSGAPL